MNHKSANTDPRRILVAGIGGASLGTEVLKCLAASGRFDAYGCDISEFAYGHYQGGLKGSFVIDRTDYIAGVRDVCLRHGISTIVPGGEEPAILLSKAADRFASDGILLAVNSPDVVGMCSNKARLFERLSELQLPAPRTIGFQTEPVLAVLEGFAYPCIVKPAVDSGGSRHVFLVSNARESLLYINYILKSVAEVVVQEYVPVEEGEFTIGVLHGPDRSLLGSIALKRLLHAKLSVLNRSALGVISTGYSQGFVDEFPEVCRQAEKIAEQIGSRGPLNIQGRVRGGVLLPFEINPRFSASTYLRCLAGFNEIDLYLRYVGEGSREVFRIRPGYYFRTLAETYVAPESIVH